jgi:hypothetical protein
MKKSLVALTVLLSVLALMTSNLPSGYVQAQSPVPFLYLPVDVSWWDEMSAMMDHRCPLDSTDGTLWTYNDQATAFNPTAGHKLCADNETPAGFSEANCTDPDIYPGYEFRTYDETWAWYDGHEGYDWSVQSGTSVYAAADGIVECAGWADGSCARYLPGSFSGYGYVVVVAHPSGYKTLYAHLTPDSENPDGLPSWPNVTPYDKIASSGNSGGTDPHLHFSVLHNGKYTDPFGWEEWGWPGTDPLRVCTYGEESHRLWVDDWPHRPGQPAEMHAAAPPNLRYVGGALPRPSPPILDSATFLSDVTLPNDGPPRTTGENLIKTWRVRNSGSSIWNNYKLIFVGGHQMNAPSPIDVPYAAPGDEINISIPIQVPETSATGYWQIVNSSGSWVLGGNLRIRVSVQGSSLPDNIEIVNASYPTVVEPGQSFRPEVTIRVNNGELLQSRGDMLRHKEGELYGAWPHVAVEGSVGTGQTYTFRFYENNPITAPGTAGTYSSKWQVWADGRYVGPEITIEFRVFEGNRPPPAPSLHTPEDYASSHDNPSFCVHTPTDPDGDAINGYQFEIVNGPTPWQSPWQAPPYNCSEQPQLAPGEYTWRARVRDSHGNVSDWSNIRHFTKLAGVSVTTFDFSVSSPSDAEQIWIHTNGDVPTGETIVRVNEANDGTTNGKWHGINHFAGGLEVNSLWNTLDITDGPHVVRVTLNANGGTGTQDKVYTLLHRRPAGPGGIWPRDDVWTGSRTVSLQWGSGVQANSSYHLVISDQPNPITDPTPLYNETFNTETTSYTLTFDQDYHDLYWYISASNDRGTNVGGDNYHFGIDLDPPSSAVQTLPAVSTDTKFTIRWDGSDARSGLGWYDVQVRDSRDNEWHDWLANTTDTTAIFTGQPGHTYYFRARAMDEVGNWEEYPAGNGDAFTLVDPTSAPPTAWWNDQYAFKHNLFILNSESRSTPAGYSIHLHLDSSTTPTAQEVYDASQSSTKGDDVRIVYQDTTELDRFIQNFESNAIDIWFATQAAISGNSSDENNYQLYYGNPATSNPPSDINAVFFPRPDSNTIALWHFQEGSGSTVHDSSGWGHHGTFSGAGWTDGRFGNAGLFNGSNSEVNFGNHGDFNLGAMTLEGWILVDRITGSYEHIFNKETYWLRLTGSRKLHFQAFSGEASFNCPELELNRWYHVAATFNGSNDYRLYVNGQQCAQKTESHTPYHTNAPLKLGWTTNWPDTLHFPGQMQHMRVSNIARTDFPFTHKETDPIVEAGNVIMPPGSGSPDLVLQSLFTYPVDGTTFESGLMVQAIVRNQGDAPTTNGFYTDFYADHLPVEAGDFNGSIGFLVNDPIAAGSTVTLTTVISDLVSVGSLSTLGELRAMEETSATLYTQADSTGVVKETDDANNIYSAGVEICIAAPDTYEGTDNDASTNNILALGVSQSHNFHAMEDEDWLKIQSSGGMTYTIRTSDLGPNADTYLYLYDTDGTTLLAANDDHGGTLASQVEWIAPATATYYLAVKHWNPNAGGCGTTYSISFSEKGKGGTLYLPLILKNK